MPKSSQIQMRVLAEVCAMRMGPMGMMPAGKGCRPGEEILGEFLGIVKSYNAEKGGPAALGVFQENTTASVLVTYL